MKPGVLWTTAVLLAALMLLTGIPPGCTKVYEAAGSEGMTVYYLYPGEPAPVEGPQMRTEDFERFLRFIETRSSSEKRM